MEPDAQREGHSSISGRSALWVLCILVFIILTCRIWGTGSHSAQAGDVAGPQASATPGAGTYLPIIYRMPSPTPLPPTGATYSAIPVESYVPPDRPDYLHPDLNLDLRGYEHTDAWLGLVDYSGQTYTDSVKLAALFNPWRLPQFVEAYRVYDWDWAHNQRGSLITQWPVTLVRMAAETGELIYLPYRAADIYQGIFHAMVLYATDNQITLTYTRKDTVAEGFTVHLSNIQVDLNLVALYQVCNRDGRHNLPGITNGQPIGRAQVGGILVAICDRGSFMDPRSRKDWWAGF